MICSKNLQNVPFMLLFLLTGLGSSFDGELSDENITLTDGDKSKKHFNMEGRSLARPITRVADENISDKAYSRDMLRRHPAL